MNITSENYLNSYQIAVQIVLYLLEYHGHFVPMIQMPGYTHIAEHNIPYAHVQTPKIVCSDMKHMQLQNCVPKHPFSEF